jgi:hypothetical protein
VIGGAPIFAPAPAFVAAPPIYRPAAPPAAPRVQSVPTAPSQTAAPAPRPVVRAKSADEPDVPPRPLPPEPRLAPVTLPAPEQLGIGVEAVAEDVDWNTVHRRLRELGSLSSQLQRTGDGYRFVCLLPTTQADRAQRIEAAATTEAEAVRLALARAELWARGR